jgi:hypothetical protein
VAAAIAVPAALRSTKDDRVVTIDDPTGSPTPVASPGEPTPHPSPSPTRTRPRSSEAETTTPPPEANGASKAAVVSATGRYIAFASDATNLTASDDNGATDVFWRDRVEKRTVRVSLSPTGEELPTSSWVAAISGDGQIVVFIQYDKIFGVGEQEATAIAWYAADMRTRKVRRLRLPNEMHGMTLSVDGRFATISAGAYRSGMVYLYDMGNAEKTPVSVSTDGHRANDDAWGGSMSEDYRYIVFDSDATNLISHDTNHARDVFLRDMVERTTTRISVTAEGKQAESLSMEGQISRDGKTITFSSTATNIDAGPTCPIDDQMTFSWTPYVVNRETGERHSLYGEHRDTCSGTWAISTDGSRMMFRISSYGLGVLDRSSGTMLRAFRTCPADDPGEAGDEGGPHPTMSESGRLVVSPTVCAERSDDGNRVSDVYAIDVDIGTIDRVSVPDGN